MVYALVEDEAEQIVNAPVEDAIQPDALVDVSELALEEDEAELALPTEEWPLQIILAV